MGIFKILVYPLFYQNSLLSSLDCFKFYKMDNATPKEFTIPASLVNYNSPELIQWHAAKYNQPELEVKRTFRKLKEFLWQCYMAPGNSPSVEVDLLWHSFILHTAAYEKFCFEKFGRMIHHYPEIPGTGHHGSNCKDYGLQEEEEIATNANCSDLGSPPEEEEKRFEQLSHAIKASCGDKGGKK